MLPCLLLVAEVMDKEPTAGRYWAVASLLAVVGHYVARWRPWALAVVLPFVLLHVGMTILHVDDPCISTAIRHEAGWGYLFHVHASLMLALLGPLQAIVRADLPTARAWWAAVASQRLSSFGYGETPYRAVTHLPGATLTPWRLVAVLGIVGLALLGIALVQVERILTRCTWDP
jgi:hypothetical protein